MGLKELLAGGQEILKDVFVGRDGKLNFVKTALPVLMQRFNVADSETVLGKKMGSVFDAMRFVLSVDLGVMEDENGVLLIDESDYEKLDEIDDEVLDKLFEAIRVIERINEIYGRVDVLE